MKKSVTLIKQKLGLLGAVVVATMVGGLSTAIVLASIPDSNGNINACYKNSTHALSVTDPAGNCGNGFTALSWSQNGSGGGSSSSPVVQDASGQVLGNLVGQPSAQQLEIYNQTLKRDIIFFFSGDTNTFLVNGQWTTVFFTTTDCTGQAYVSASDSSVKMRVIRIAANTYAEVQTSAQPQSLTYNSILNYDGPTDTFGCMSVSPSTDNLDVLSSVSLPFTVPVAIPFEYQ